MRRLTIAVLLVLLANGAHARDCDVYRVPLTLGTNVGYQVIAASGEDCRVAVRIPDFSVESNEIISHPRYGGARVDGTTATYYRSNPGYRGADAFAFSLCGRTGGRAGCSTVRVKVQVR
jgi:hypothetical protein